MNSSDIIAVIALVISVATAVGDVVANRNINKVNLNSYYFNEIYREHLIAKIPKARKRISLNYNGRLVGYEDMIQEMKDLQNDSLFYKYNDEKYFAKLKEAAQNMEDFLIAGVGETFVGEEQTCFMEELHNLMTELYKTLNNQYVR